MDKSLPQIALFWTGPSMTIDSIAERMLDSTHP